MSFLVNFYDGRQEIYDGVSKVYHGEVFRLDFTDGSYIEMDEETVLHWVKI